MFENSFKQCILCKHNWNTREELLSDPSVKFIGYQVNFDELLLGFLLFNHKCRTTIAIPVNIFQDLNNSTIYQERKTGSSECPG